MTNVTSAFAAGQAGAFLRQDAASRAAALGGAVTALVDDSSALSSNPAGLGRLAKPEVSATHVTLFEDTTFDFVSGGFATQKWGGFGAAYILQNSGGFEARQSPNDAPASFSVGQSALIGGWGRAFALPVARPGWMTQSKPLLLGFSLKQAKESVGSTSASGSGADAGLILQPRADMMLGVMVQNLIAPTLTYVSAPIPYPREIDVSPAYLWKVSDDWHGAAAIKFAKLDGDSLAVSGGVELQYRKLAALRLGVKDNALTTGVGVRFGNSSFEYAASMQDLGLSHIISFTQRFGQTREELEETIRKGIRQLSYAEGTRLSRAYLTKADDELRAGKTSEALSDLEAASLLDPGNAGIRTKIEEVKARWDADLKRQTVEHTARLAREQAEQGNALAARQYWRSVLELDDRNTEAIEELKRIDDALSAEEKRRLEGLHQAESANDIALALAQAATFLAGGKLRQAKSEAEKVLERFPGNEQILKFLDQVRDQTQAFAAEKLAASQKLAAEGSVPEALREVEAGLREAPGDKALLAQVQALRSQLQKAITPEERKQFEQLYYKAVELYLRGDYKSADGLADELLKIDPTSDSAKTLKDKVQAALRYSQ